MVDITQPQQSVRELAARLAALLNQPGSEPEWFWFTGDASTTDFALPAGWKPKAVFNAGSLQKDGASDEYTLSGPVNGVYTVSFAVAPANGNDIGVEAWR